jgi:hypothetical protein
MCGVQDGVCGVCVSGVSYRHHHAASRTSYISVLHSYSLSVVLSVPPLCCVVPFVFGMAVVEHGPPALVCDPCVPFRPVQGGL